MKAPFLLCSDETYSGFYSYINSLYYWEFKFVKKLDSQKVT